jgi:hypothetical protein
MMRELALGYCGLDCERCPVFVATVKNDNALRRETAEQWSKLLGEYLAARLGRSQLDPSEMTCHGCRSTSLFIGCSVCEIRSCARGRGLGSCAHCSAYDVCELLKGFYSVYPDARAALDEIRAASPEDT